jgi:ribosome-binding factor A
MTVPGHRHERIAEEILHELSAMLEGELQDPRISEMSSVTEVRVTPDLKLAKVYVSVRATEAERSATLAALTSASGYIRGELGQRLRMRRSPELHFVLDRTDEYAERIEQLLRDTKRPSDS